MRILIAEPSYYLPNGKLFRMDKLQMYGLAAPYLAGLCGTEHSIELWFDKLGPHAPKKIRDYDLALITSSHTQAVRANEISKDLQHDGIPTVCGGYYPWMDSDIAQKHFDSIACGEAELLLPSILKDAECGRLKEQYTTTERAVLNGLPLPRVDLIRMDKLQRWTLHPIQATRGCLRNCDFCCITKCYGRRVVKRPIKEVVAEVEQRGKLAYLFVDDNLLAYPDYTLKLFEALKGRLAGGVIECDPMIVKRPELLTAFTAAGIKEAYIGFEDIERPEEVKGSSFTIELYEECVRKCHEHGLAVDASLIFGFDWHRKDCFKKTLDWLQKNKVDFIFPYVLTPVTGSVLYEQLKREKRLIYGDEYWRQPGGATGLRAVFDPKHMTPRELEQGVMWILNEFYGVMRVVKRCWPPSYNRTAMGIQQLYIRKLVKSGLHPVMV